MNSEAYLRLLGAVMVLSNTRRYLPLRNNTAAFEPPHTISTIHYRQLAQNDPNFVSSRSIFKFFGEHATNLGKRRLRGAWSQQTDFERGRAPRQAGLWILDTASDATRSHIEGQQPVDTPVDPELDWVTDDFCKNLEMADPGHLRISMALGGGTGPGLVQYARAARLQDDQLPANEQKPQCGRSPQTLSDLDPPPAHVVIVYNEAQRQYDAFQTALDRYQVSDDAQKDDAARVDGRY
ncbi:hypothetical protein BJ508DRAFT_364371 [Ascobolus immersus RN42]|uniref:Uncharacterized protein n=1 Tax=Ascobolus immersus RN42 TaxID=1160509 RepID=A0A3N4HUV0_ASCIM|nr:hypothetical protein BJ508DRAFT_364371 [Ascobolus immersus RN42]